MQLVQHTPDQSGMRGHVGYYSLPMRKRKNDGYLDLKTTP